MPTRKVVVVLWRRRDRYEYLFPSEPNGDSIVDNAGSIVARNSYDARMLLNGKYRVTRWTWNSKQQLYVGEL